MRRPTSSLAGDVGRVFRAARTAIRLSQDELGARSGVTQSKISRLERGLHSGVDLDELERLGRALSGRVRIELLTPFLAERERQRDGVHGRCCAFVATRLRRSGWQAEVEVEVRGSSGSGWIDILAWHARSSTLLVIEIKTEVHDLGRVQRTLAWYESGAREAARASGWQPERLCGALLLLDTIDVRERLRENAALIRIAFPARAADLAGILTDPFGVSRGGRAVAVFDPLSRRANWVRPTVLDGRRTPPPYADYAEIARRLASPRAASR